MSSSSEQRPLPEVLIAGAGLGGLLMAILLDKIGIPYRILERASKVKALGAVMSLGPHIMPVFEQLGILDELLSISIKCTTMNLLDESLKSMGTVDMGGQKELTGYESVLFIRPELTQILLSRVPASKILLNKQVVDIEDNPEQEQVTVHCADGSSYKASLLIGADGTYSNVRQSLYKTLDEKGLLPMNDTKELEVGFACIVGTTSPMDPEKYPVLKDDFGHFDSIIGGRYHNWGACNITNNRFTWGMNLQFASEAEAKKERFANAEWSPEASTAEMLKEFLDRPTPFGGKMRDIVEATPPELISKVYHEHKLYETWHHGRTVLIGDACHKLLPASGMGATNAFHDAVVLANCLFDLEDVSYKSITAAFESYYSQRYEKAKIAYNASLLISKIMAGQTWSDRLIRTIFLNYLPRWVQLAELQKTAGYRPQIMFLPLAPNRGSIAPEPQQKCRRYVATSEE